jgi:hypothetical protein
VNIDHVAHRIIEFFVKLSLTRVVLLLDQMATCKEEHKAAGSCSAGCSMWAIPQLAYHYEQVILIVLVPMFY